MDDAQESSIQPGTSVTLVGLKSAPQLNGMVGRVIRLDVETGRWQVDLGEEGIKALRPDNLIPEDGDLGHSRGRTNRRRIVEPRDDAAPGDLIRRLLQDGSDDGEREPQDAEWDDEQRLHEGRIGGEEEENGGDLYDPEEEVGDQPPLEEEAENNTQWSDDEEDRGEYGREEERGDYGGEEDIDFEGTRQFDGDEDTMRSGGGQGEEAPPGVQDAVRVETDSACRGSPPPAATATAQAVGADSEEFAKYSVRELKDWLAARAVDIPLGVTEKGELVDLCKRSLHLPVRPPASQSRQPSGRRAERHKRSHRQRDMNNHEPSTTSTPAAMPVQQPLSRPPTPVGYWSAAPAWSGGFHPPPPPPGAFGFPFGGPPLYGPPPGGGYGPGLYRPPSGPGPVPLVTRPPQSREEAVARAEERLRFNQPSEDSLATIARFVQDHRLCDEVELGLRLINPDQSRCITSNPSVLGRLRDTGDPNEAVLWELHHMDPDAEAIVRTLLVSGRRERDGQGVHHKDHGTDGSRRRSRSGRHRRREGCGSRSRHRRRHDAGSGRSHDLRAPPGQHSVPRTAVASTRGGVWGSPDRGSKRDGRDIETWLVGLDQGRGAMLRYLPALRREFGELPALAATVLPKPTSSSVVGCIDPSLWEALGVDALGHRLLLAKGIVALSKSERHARP